MSDAQSQHESEQAFQNFCEIGTPSYKKCKLCGDECDQPNRPLCSNCEETMSEDEQDADNEGFYE